MSILYPNGGLALTHFTIGYPVIQPVMPAVVYLWSSPEAVQVTPSKDRNIQSEQRKTTKKLVSQNPKRNIITNIGNQLITFISSRRKSQRALREIYPQWSAEDISGYYTFADRVKQQSEYYLNIDKIRKMWHNKSDKTQAANKRRALRKLSMYHLNNILPASILSSRKMKGDSKLLHLQARRILIAQLRHPHQRYSFI